jgi:hypothetical protein
MGSIPGQGNQSGIHEEGFFTAEATPLIIDREQGVQMTYIRLAKLLLTLALFELLCPIKLPVNHLFARRRSLKGRI